MGLAPGMASALAPGILSIETSSSSTKIGVGYSKVHKKHKEGDIWEDGGKTWTIKNGVQQNVTKLDAAKKEVRIPLACPKCKGTMNYYLSQKMYKIHKMCFDCVIDYEAELRKAGLYQSYEKNMMQGSLKAFARDVEQWVLDSLETTNSFVTEQGDLEDWNNNDSKFKEQMTANLQEYLKHIRSHID